MNRLSTEKRAQIVGCLVEGMSIRASVRMTGAAKNTVVKLLADLGDACDRYQDEVLVNLPSKRVQCDEVWTFCYAKQKNVPVEHKGTFGYGDVWTWKAICADTKLIPCWRNWLGSYSRRSGKPTSLRSRSRNQPLRQTDPSTDACFAPFPTGFSPRTAPPAWSHAQTDSWS